MLQQHPLDIRLYQAVLLFFDHFAHVLEKSPILKADVAQFRTMVANLVAISKTEKEGANVTAADKLALKTRIAQNVRLVLDKLAAHAIKTQNNDLKKACKTSFSTLVATSDENFADAINEQIKLMKPYDAVLDLYLLDAAFRQSLVDDLETFGNMRPQLHVERSRLAVGTSNRNDAFKNAKEYLNVVLAEAVATLEDKEPDFVQGFEDVVQGPTYTVSNTKVVVKTIDAQTKAPVADATIEVPELATKDVPEFKETTDEKGKLAIKVGKNKTIVLKISKTGFVSQEIMVAKIKRGKSLDVEVIMVAETKGS